MVNTRYDREAEIFFMAFLDNSDLPERSRGHLVYDNDLPAGACTVLVKSASL
jgi:hypothetical protein